MSLNVVDGGRTNRRPAPDDKSGNQTEVFILPEHVVERLEKTQNIRDKQPKPAKVSASYRQRITLKKEKPDS